MEWIAFSCSSSIVFANGASVFALSLDPAKSTFVPTQSWRFPFSGEGRIMAAGTVSNDELGLNEPYIVLLRKSNLWVGHISWDKELVECEVEVPLTDLWATTKRSKSNRHIEGCWLSDGPTVICLSSGRLLVASSIIPTHWSVDVLEFSGSKTQPRVHMCGTEAILSLTFDETKSWSYFSLIRSMNSETLSRWRVVSPDSVLKQRLDVFPAELQPSLVSSCTKIPPTPAAALTYLLDMSLRPPSDVVIGTRDKRLLRCVDGKITQVIEVEDVPLSLSFSVARGGHGTISVEYCNTVAALCAESYKVLQVWPGFHLYSGDFMNLGHEQRTALVSSETSSLEDFLNALNVVNSSSGTEAAESYKMKMMKMGSKLLDSRALSGRLQLEDQQKKNLEKVELLKSSLKLLQGMSHKHIEASIPRLATVTSIDHFTARNHLVIVIRLQCAAPEEVLLKNVTLLVTGIRGRLEATSTVLGGFHCDDGVRELSVVVPLNKNHIHSLQAINVLLAAEITNDANVKIIEWLCRVDTNCETLTHYDFAKQLPSSFVKIRDLVVSSPTRNWKRLIDVLKSSLRMEIRTFEENTIQLEGTTWSHFVQVSLSWSEGTTAVLTLKAEDLQQLNLLWHLIEKTLRDEDILESVSHFSCFSLTSILFTFQSSSSFVTSWIAPRCYKAWKISPC